MTKKLKVAFQGELGAYSHLACLKIFPNADIKACRTFTEVFNLASKNSEYRIVVPITNSSTGSVADMNYLIPQYKLQIHAEYFHKVQLEILTNSIKTVLNTLPNKDCKLVSAGVGRFLVKIIAEKLGIPLIEFSELFDCDKKSQHNSNICAPAIAIAQLSRLSKIK